MKGYGLYHRLTNGEDLPSFIETVLENNGAMVSTVEKLRAGIPVGGMSPAADMDTGGATYVFTRIRKLPTAGGSRDTGLYFKKRLLRRMDAISYDHDAFGRVRDDYVSHHRGSTPAARGKLHTGGTPSKCWAYRPTQAGMRSGRRITDRPIATIRTR